MTKIENLREKLHNVMDHGDGCEILAISQELDDLIVLYMKLQLSTRTDFSL
ncbi:aspartyl-phosphate phosphatase Spo0E family protein [Acetivibrio clariflavus]|uniref:Spo0E like sporulation regulatory protein n=1 Tax=Acetivibrio clariflavus (strain DSM 19732 / NBRC 101661 / EBR45) TaxID=720554 RepID=G8LV41_ACECE|nr:aspartyl-phosphate phosphatase Spo0E family protein [Acetivibrio clariflavus]AEV69618.1 Spo0E like sporulation regulatory protein [Acetivibrio clariflavus DSM 19732]